MKSFVSFHFLIVITMLFSSHIYANSEVGAEAIRKGDLTALKEHLENPKVDLNGLDKNGETLLHISINFHNLEAQDLLLQQEEIDPNRRKGTSDATPPLAMAVANRLYRGFLRSDLPLFSESKSLEAINALLKHPKTDPNKGGAFVYAAQGGDLVVVKSFLKYRGDDLSLSSLEEGLSRALFGNHFDVAIELLTNSRIEVSEADFQYHRRMVKHSSLSFKQKRTLYRLLKKKKNQCY